jgi:hypothetical protein
LLSGTRFKEIATTPHSSFERSHEDNEENFVLGSERRFYRSGRNYGAVETSDMDVDFPNEFDAEDEMSYTLARELVFGDFHYPVVHEDYRDPYLVQQEVCGV